MSKNSSNGFSSIIIGSGSLPIRCAEAILKMGHTIDAIVSSDKDLAAWAKRNAITHFNSIESFETGFASLVDHLFSINNEYILSRNILRLAKKYAINYHDALLPRYAGTHATSWALMNGERTHGITWHIIEDKVDAGDILRQRTVNVTSDETAYSLNMKCFEAAILEFEELINDLSANKIERTNQDSSKRSFYSRYKRPKNGGIVSWEQPAHEISRLVRALSFGNNPNALGRAKLMIEGEFFLVDKIEVLNVLSSACPGTIVMIENDFLQVACADKDIIIKITTTVDGLPVSISELALRFQLHQGYQLVNVEANTTERIDELIKNIVKHEDYWVNQLSKVNPVNVPFARATRFGESAEYLKLPLLLPDEFLAFVDQASDEHHFHVKLLAAFVALLSRLTGIEDFSIGYTDLGMKSKIGDFGGLFATTVPLTINIGHQESFQDLIGSLSQEVDKIHVTTTYLRDVETRYPQLSSDENLTSSRLLTAAFAQIDEIETFVSTIECELIFAVSNRECFWIFNRKSLGERDVEELSRILCVLLKSFLKRPESDLGSLALVTDVQRQMILFDWNDSATEYSTERCVHQIFEEYAKQIPDAIAVVCDDQRLTYSELNEKASIVAHHLRSRGETRGNIIAICMYRSIELVVGILAILKAGATYLPLDPTYPESRLAYMIEDSGANIVVTQECLRSRFDATSARVVLLDKEMKGSTAASENLAPVTNSNDLAYVIYTSGSTGQPKAVEIEHRALMNLVIWHQRQYATSSDDRATLLASPAFDASVWEMWPYLTAGASIYIPSENIRSTPQKLITWLHEMEITICFAPTPLAEAMLELEISPDISLRFLLTGGDRLHPIPRSSLPFELINHYGPTENTVVSTFGKVETGNGRAPSLGRPITNVQAYVLDRNFQPLPVGVPGELYIGGSSLARGYLRRPELTAERFVKNPFSSDESARLYKTGDLVKYVGSGEIDFIGRIDNQVKVRGFRIELAEIESVISQFGDVREAVVVAREENWGEKRLVAYLVSRTVSKIEPADLRKYLKQKLPAYMVPSAYVQLEYFPLTPNGKIDQKALPLPERESAGVRHGFEAPRSDTEMQLAAIWNELLGVDQIGIHDNFFDFGGHSLLAIRMFALVEERFQKNIPLATLFEAGTIAKLAEIIDQDDWAQPESSIVPIKPYGARPPLFCVHAGGGNVLFYRDFAKYLHDEQPLYGIQARRIGGRQVAHGTIEEMATFYISELKTVQPNGPYYIGGSSFGGLAAFEMARQLLDRGECVALLALLDTGSPSYPKLSNETTPFKARIYRSARKMHHHFDSLRGLEGEHRLAYVAAKFRKVRLKYRRKFKDLYRKAAKVFYLKYKGAGSLPSQYIKVEDQISKAYQKYVPKPYSGKMTLFRATNQPLGIVHDPTLGWDEIPSELEIHEVPGHHGSIVAEPYVRLLAAKLTECIEKSIIVDRSCSTTDTIRVISTSASPTSSKVAA